MPELTWKDLVVGRTYRIADNSINRSADLPIGKTVVVRESKPGSIRVYGARDSASPNIHAEWCTAHANRFEELAITSREDAELKVGDKVTLLPTATFNGTYSTWMRGGCKPATIDRIASDTEVFLALNGLDQGFMGRGWWYLKRELELADATAKSRADLESLYD